ncbi:MAG: PD-(D/E)XK nuclease family protein, partial [Granulosicoccus sp.]|nr:PD-(D/E)XK nuclease family protein [Granulosicoccus sp.]
MVKPISVSVTALAQFSCRRGDLIAERVIGPTSGQGIKAHKRIQKTLLEKSDKRNSMEVETSLNCDCTLEGRSVRLTARVDFLDRAACLVGEIKSTLVPPDKLPKDQTELHWAQLIIYGYVFSQSLPTDSGEDAPIDLKLVYIDLRADKAHEQLRTMGREQLQEFTLAALGDYVRWVVKLEQYNSTMMQNAIQLSFPFGDFRAGQR